MRSGIARLLVDAGIDVVRRPATPTTSCARASPTVPHVAVVDVQMPPRTRTTGSWRRSSCAGACRAPACSSSRSSTSRRWPSSSSATTPKASGYLLKERVGEVSAFVDAIERVAAGGSVIDPSVVRQMLGRRRRDDPLGELTPRERTVLAVMAEGKSNAGIADALTISGASVEKHVTAIFRKLGLRNEVSEHRRVQAVLTYVRSTQGHP
jgi:DNA-binding NarL/FixJ family response regulator